MECLNKKEKAWLLRFEKCMSAAPDSLMNKLDSYTIGDPNIVIYDKKKFEVYEKTLGHREELDVCEMVDNSNAETLSIFFPFGVQSTAG